MQSLLLPVILFSLSMTITPGPNNMLLTASGAKFGYRKTLPLIIGIVMGILSQLFLSALGLGVIFQNFPIIKSILKIIGTAYILYLSIRIAFQNTKGKKEDFSEQPLNTIQGAAFQYLNPKAYIMTATAMSVFPLEGELYRPSALFIIACFLIITPLSISVWACFGSILNRWMPSGNSQRRMNFILGGLTAASAVFIIL